MPQRLTVDDPYRGEVACDLALAGIEEAVAMVERAAAAQRAFARTPVAERAALVERFGEAALRRKEESAADITRTMGKPIREARGEVDTMVARARHLASIAGATLVDRPLPEKPGFRRFIAREPLGVVLDIAPWNY